ncbi:MAG: hypothetical protein QM713_02890 [Arachnia sp.]
MTDDPTHVPLTPAETSALVQRAIHGGERRLRTRRIAAGTVSIAVVAALGISAYSFIGLPERPSVATSPSPPAISRLPTTPDPHPIAFDAEVQHAVESLLDTRLGAKVMASEPDPARSGDRYVADGVLGADVPVQVVLGSSPDVEQDKEELHISSPLADDNTFWEVTLAAGPGVREWGRQRADGATITLRVGMGSLPGDEVPPDTTPPSLSEEQAVEFLSDAGWESLLDAVATAR